MQVRAFELRDRATFIAVLAVNLVPVNPAQHWLVRRCGYAYEGKYNVIMTRLHGDGRATNDPYAWGSRTMQTAHNYIIDKWDTLHDGDVIDVEFILGEKPEPKTSERITT